MRCNNCGFENAGDATHCIKCKTALDNTAAREAPAVAPRKETSYAGTILDSQLDKLTRQGSQDATHQTSQDATHNAPQSAPHHAPTLIHCTHADCGYPYSSELKVCPRCQRPAAATARPFTGTIDPYRIPTPVETPSPPVCYLLPVARTGETPDGTPQKLSFTYQQRSIELNRDNLDPGNPSITGKVQAELTYEDGAWQLKDRSELQTTFLLASALTPLKDGDILLLGDRKFVFSSSPNQ